MTVRYQPGSDAAWCLRRVKDGRYFVRKKRGRPLVTAWCLAGARLWQDADLGEADAHRQADSLGGAAVWQVHRVVVGP